MVMASLGAGVHVAVGGGVLAAPSPPSQAASRLAANANATNTRDAMEG